MVGLKVNTLFSDDDDDSMISLPIEGHARTVFKRQEWRIKNAREDSDWKHQETPQRNGLFYLKVIRKRCQGCSAVGHWFYTRSQCLKDHDASRSSSDCKRQLFHQHVFPYDHLV